MKTFKILIFTIVLITAACKQPTPVAEVVSETAANLTTCEVKISGMTCTGCEQSIETAVIGLEGIKSVKASHTEGLATIVAETEKFDSVLVKSKINDLGYTALNVTIK